jgi:hypothetical protein
MLLSVTDTLVKVQLTPFTQIKFLKLEKINGVFTRETLNFSFSSPQTSVIVTVNSSSNEILIIVLELNLENSELVYYNQDQEIQQEDPEIKEQLENIKNLFGGENVLSLNESTIDETNNVFNNFGKGLSSMFSMGTAAPQVLPPKEIEIKNENSKMLWKITKKPING